MREVGPKIGARVCALVIAFSALAPAVEAQECRRVKPVGAPPYSAEDYPYPLSLRINLVRMMKREMAAIGRYSDPKTVKDHVFTDELEDQIKGLQAERGEPETGCITWKLVMTLDSEGHEPPLEALEAFQ